MGTCKQNLQVSGPLLKKIDSPISDYYFFVFHVFCCQIAERVTDERMEPLGTSVGYQIGLEK